MQSLLMTQRCILPDMRRILLDFRQLLRFFVMLLVPRSIGTSLAVFGLGLEPPLSGCPIHHFVGSLRVRL